MQIKIEGKIFTWLLVGILISVLMPLSVFYANSVTSKTEDAGEEGNTTIIRVYKQPGIIEVQPPSFYLDVEHRLYPDSIVVQPHSSVDLFLDYICNIEGSGDWNVQSSDNIELIVEVPRMPSNCSIESNLAFHSEYQNREFYVTITFNNPNNEAWNVGRPLVKVLSVYLGFSEITITTPTVEVILETNIS